MGRKEASGATNHAQRREPRGRRRGSGGGQHGRPCPSAWQTVRRGRCGTPSHPCRRRLVFCTSLDDLRRLRLTSRQRLPASAGASINGVNPPHGVGTTVPGAACMRRNSRHGYSGSGRAAQARATRPLPLEPRSRSPPAGARGPPDPRTGSPPSARTEDVQCKSSGCFLGVTPGLGLALTPALSRRGEGDTGSPSPRPTPEPLRGDTDETASPRPSPGPMREPKRGLLLTHQAAPPSRCGSAGARSRACYGLRARRPNLRCPYRLPESGPTQMGKVDLASTGEYSPAKVPNRL